MGDMVTLFTQECLEIITAVPDDCREIVARSRECQAVSRRTLTGRHGTANMKGLVDKQRIAHIGTVTDVVSYNFV